MNITSKGDIFSPAFAVEAGGLVIKPDVAFSGVPPIVNPFIALPETLAPGVDYSIHPDDTGGLMASPARIPGEVGGFHAGLDGQIVEASIWDSKFRPTCPDPRGMVLIQGLFWADIYLTGEDADRTSAAGVAILRNITYWQAVERLATHGKQLLSIDEFYLATVGSEERKNAPSRPELTGHIDGLRSACGLEQATGCMWTWGRHCDPRTDTAALMGGGWRSDFAGPRQLNSGYADLSDDLIGARGRCDHLLLA